MTLRLKLKDVVNVTSTRTMLEQNNKVLYIWRAQNNEFVLNLFESMAFENLTTIVTTTIEQMFNKEGFINAQKYGRYFCIEHSIDLLLYQLLTLIHNLFTPTIYNKVNHNPWNRLEFIKNIINMTFTRIYIERVDWRICKWRTNLEVQEQHVLSLEVGLTF